MTTPTYLPILVTRQTCRICGSKALSPVIDLGSQFISGSFADPNGTPPVQRKIPLELVRCDPSQDQNACGLVQLRHTVPPPILYRSYWYQSGINQTMRDNLAGIAGEASRLVNLQRGDVVVDIGCNDGTLLNAYPDSLGIKRIGFEPSKQMAAIAKGTGLRVINDFFNSVAFLNEGEDDAKIITSIAMFYDLENPHAFVNGIHTILHPGGVWILELSYLPSMLKMNSYDTICHEHLEYYSLAPLERLLQEHALKVLDVSLNAINGGSFRVTVGHLGKEQTAEQAERVQALRVREFEQALDSETPYQIFRGEIIKLRSDICAVLVDLKNQGKVVHGYGASTKGNTILQFCAVNPEYLPYIADRNPAKHGSCTIGTNIPIISEEQSRAMKPDYYLALPWHFIEEFKHREAEFLARGGKFIVPMPEVQILE